MTLLGRLSLRTTAITAVILVVGFFILVPFYFVVLGSLKSPAEAAELKLTLPSVWKWDNYSYIIQDVSIVRYFGNSLLISVTGTVFIVFAASMAAFVLGRRQQKFALAVYYIFVAGLIAPPQIIPTIKIMQGLGLYNTFGGLVLFYSAIVFPFCVFLITGFIKGVPRELDESSWMDGCSPVRLFVSIILPLLAPVAATAAIFAFMTIWNDFQWPFFLLTETSKWTLPLSVFKYVSQYGTKWHYVFAILMLVMLPVIIAFVFAQKYIIAGMTAGAIKG